MCTNMGVSGGGGGNRGALSEKQVSKFEDGGFRYWSKGDKERLYTDAENIGLEYRGGKYYLDDEKISNNDAGKIKRSSFYVDVKTGETHVEDNFADRIHQSWQREYLEEQLKKKASEIRKK